MADDEKRNSLKEDIVEQIEKLDVLREKGFITSQAYEKRKTELLERLRSRAAAHFYLRPCFLRNLCISFCERTPFKVLCITL